MISPETIFDKRSEKMPKPVFFSQFVNNLSEKLNKNLTYYNIIQNNISESQSIFEIHRYFYQSEDNTVEIEVASILVTYVFGKEPTILLIPTVATSVRDHQNLYRAFKGEANLPITI